MEKGKITIFIVVIFLLVFVRLFPCQVESGGTYIIPGRELPLPNFHWESHSLYTVISNGFEWSPLILDAYMIHRSSPIFLLLYPLYFVIGYASLLKISRRKFNIRGLMAPQKSKFILFLLGLISLFPFIAHFISGQVGGTMNFTPLQRNFYGFSEMFFIILLPFAIFTYYGLFRVNVLLPWLLATLFEPNPLSSIWEFARLPEYLSLRMFLIIMPLFVIEWYFISSVIVETFREIKQKKRTI